MSLQSVRDFVTGCRYRIPSRSNLSYSFRTQGK